ncbi:prepilin-type N-terminal cleavage/methylation domain-containing protein [Ramlibacter sp. AW1]|uniref:Prepilin-type N-terminal cleavage/methylation domain-containing protein n=2 Tax=Ramlibacter aurantiacus TaxID=2801330 RepID=A0A936ZM70_9BURK|nr:prepilin-type N-terminal cleavage/methylation domain-containing protein [Ramlibacter aurantiacus]MBL0422743.1 prepilin-type N-terminal cleavage/methylation domain-containing protein [Ramlibacter aurantiacus]
MPTSAAGSSPALSSRARLLARGFTMIELLVVLAIIAIGTAGVSFAIRDSAATQLEREGLRLAALFESARAQSRSTGRPVLWQPTETGFEFQGAMPGTLPQNWLSDTVAVAGSPRLVLGPEPIIGPQEVVLVSTTAPERSVRVATGGVRPFRIVTEGAP